MGGTVLVPWLAWLWAGGAHAGTVGGGFVGFACPFDKESGSSPGFVGGAYVGYRAAVAKVRVQPELVGRYNSSAGTVVAAVGGMVTVGVPLGVGVYGHGGLDLTGALTPSGDVGIAWQGIPNGPVALGMRAGWHHDRPTQNPCKSCWIRSNNWAVITLTLVVAGGAG